MTRQQAQTNAETINVSLPLFNVDREEKQGNNDLAFGLQEEGRQRANFIEDDDEEAVRQLYEEDSQKPIFLRHFSMSETSINSNESSPLLNPLKPVKKGTPRLVGLHQTWRWYEQSLNRRPLVTKALTSGCMTFVGDIVGQCMEQRYHSQLAADGSSYHRGTLDVVRLARFTTMGMFLQAPVTHYYYAVLDHYLPPTAYPWTSVTFVKLLIDQTIYGPSFMFLVIVYLAILGGSSWNDIQQQLQHEYWTTIVNNWKVWVPATLINMAYVPPAFRVLYCNVVFFGWSIYLSLALNH